MRKTLEYTVNDSGRDNGKRFFIEEMSAFDAEAFATRLWIEVCKNDDTLNAVLGASSSCSVSELGIMVFTRLDYEQAKPFFDDLLACCKYYPDKTNDTVKRSVISVDIEEISTLINLRMEAFKLTFDFFVQGLLHSTD